MEIESYTRFSIVISQGKSQIEFDLGESCVRKNKKEAKQGEGGDFTLFLRKGRVPKVCLREKCRKEKYKVLKKDLKKTGRMAPF